MNTNWWIDYLYENRDKLDQKNQEILEMKKTMTWGEIWERFNVSGEGARNRLYRVYKIMVWVLPDYEKKVTLEDIIWVLNNTHSVGQKIDDKIKTFSHLGAEKILEIWPSNTRELTIEYVHQKTWIPKNKIDASLWKYTASEIIAQREIFCIQKCVNSQVKYGGSSLL